MSKPHVLIISPASAKANNGNWQTANRWAGFLREAYRVTICDESQACSADSRPDAVVALHARRSATAIARLSARFRDLPLILILTGTDLYRDIRIDSNAQTSLRLATRIVILQEAGLKELDESLQAKTHVLYQSASALKPVKRAARSRNFKVMMIGHLREEKDPLTYMRAAALVNNRAAQLVHIGAALDPAFERQAIATMEKQTRYHWLGNLPHAETRRRLKHSHLMVIASRMEGGANVIAEALASGVPVLASDISGNRGMLGDDYAGYFPVGDSRQLAAMIDRCATDPDYYQGLSTQCKQRAPLFSPEREKTDLLRLMDNCVHPNPQPGKT
ncbi:hypothetical protein BH11PSE11_BH11PSE11_17390 [soil metagenome]